MNIFSVTIVGLGNIGMMYDYEDNSNKTFLSHLKSFKFHSGFNVVNVVDPNKEKLFIAKEKFGNKINYLASIEDIDVVTDVFVLSSIPKVNFDYFNRLKSNNKIKFFFIEKPFWNSSIKFTDIELSSDKFYINYTRKCLPFIIDLKLDIDNHKFGKALGLHVYYSKGIKNNGSHIIDLINYLFNGNVDLSSITNISVVDDHNEKDKSFSFSVNYSYKNHDFPVIFQALNENYFSLIEFDVIFENARFRFYDFGGKVEIYKNDSDLLFEGYKNLISINTIDTKLNLYGLYSCNLIHDILIGKKRNNSKLVNESKTNELINLIIKNEE